VQDRDEQGNAMQKRAWGALGAHGTGVAVKRAVGGATMTVGRRGEVKGRRVRADSAVVPWHWTAAATVAAMSKAVRGGRTVAMDWWDRTNMAMAKQPVAGPAGGQLGRKRIEGNEEKGRIC
jgi:hypothetical protein